MKPLKEVFAPHLNRNVKFGRKKPVSPGISMKLRDYLGAALPTPPSTTDYSGPAAKELSDVDENDTLGDCVIACGYHVVGTETGNAEDLFVATNAQITADYSAIGGYVPGDPSTDQGCNIQDALNFWGSHGFANGTKILGWLAVDGTNVTEIQQAIYLFENLIFGMALPDKWISPFPSGNGFVWDVAGAPDDNNGHCVMAFGYNSSGASIDSWGLKGTITYKAVAEYAVAKTGGELYVAITPDQLAKGQTKAPNGVAWNDLLADFNSLGGHVPVPTPTPAPTPTPPVAGGVSLAQAEAAVKAAFAGSPWLITDGMAATRAVNALAALKGWPT